MILEQLGYRGLFSRAFEELGLKGTVPGRVVRQGAYSYRVLAENGEWEAEVSGRLKASVLPAVGDWVALEGDPDSLAGRIVAILPRKSAFSRSAAGKTLARQVVAANIDEVFIVTDMDRDFNLRRLERYITLVYNSGAGPVVVLNKTDLASEAGELMTQCEAVSPGIPVYAVSALEGSGLEQLRSHLAPGRTVAFLGSSGVGKSTLINRLVGEGRLEVGAVRDDDGKGRHTTTHRELVCLPGGGAVIDNPGMREIAVWGDEEGLVSAFPEVEALAGSCRFRDCRHESEPGCAVRKAVEAGDLDQERLGSYRKLREEFESLHRRKDQQARMLERKEGKRFSKMVREVDKFNPKRKK